MIFKVGSPKGGRVHWLLYNLPDFFKNKYILSYNYDTHDYLFYRFVGSKLYDVFIVKHSSLHYWKMSYCCMQNGNVEFFGYHKTKIIAEKMIELYISNTFNERVDL